MPRSGKCGGDVVVGSSDDQVDFWLDNFKEYRRLPACGIGDLGHLGTTLPGGIGQPCV